MCVSVCVCVCVYLCACVCVCVHASAFHISVDEFKTKVNYLNIIIPVTYNVINMNLETGDADLHRASITSSELFVITFL